MSFERIRVSTLPNIIIINFIDDIVEIVVDTKIFFIIIYDRG